MRKQGTFRLDLLSGDLVATLLLGLSFLSGGAAGCIAVAGIGGASGTALQDYLQAYLTLAKEQSIDAQFLPILWEQFRYPFFVFLFGFTAIGMLGIPVLFAVRGFLFSFSVSCFCRLFGSVGMIPALFLFGLPALLWAPAFFVLGTQAIRSAHTLFYCRTGERYNPLLWKGNDWVRIGLCAGALVLCSVFEYLILPTLVGASAGFLL